MAKRPITHLPCWILVGTTMSMFAGQPHPKGPENRPFVERTFRIQSQMRNCILTFSYPKPDDVVDWAPAGVYSAMNSHPTPLRLDYEYRGHFWQGVFGSVVFKVKINARKPGGNAYARKQAGEIWKDLDSLLEGIRIQRLTHNQTTKNNNPESRQEWMEPFLGQLNGIPCVQQYVYWGKDPKGEWLYYFPIDEDYALELSTRLVDNSDRPGLRQSDWRPRAEIFAQKLLSTVQVKVESMVSGK